MSNKTIFTLESRENSYLEVTKEYFKLSDKQMYDVIQEAFNHFIENLHSKKKIEYKDLRNALESFKKSGKFVWAYANTYSQKEYYLNSVANTVYLNPAGDLDFKGLSSEVMFFKDFQEKSGIHMEVIRHGKYKSAVEPFLENKMSDANREQVTALLNSIWSTVCSDISKSRNIQNTQRR